MGRPPKSDVLFTPEQRVARRILARAKARAYIARVPGQWRASKPATRESLYNELIDVRCAIPLYTVYRIANPADTSGINDRSLDTFLRGIRAIEKRRKIRL